MFEVCDETCKKEKKNISIRIFKLFQLHDFNNNNNIKYNFNTKRKKRKKWFIIIIIIKITATWKLIMHI